MKEFQNRNPLRRRPNEDRDENVRDESVRDESVRDEIVIVQGNNIRRIVSGILFLLVLIIVLGAIIRHYSRFSTHGAFVVLTEDSGFVDSVDAGEIEYKRLLVRNRYPFVLTITARLCRVEGDEDFPRLTALDTRYLSYAGVRSWYSGSFEKHITLVAAADDGRFTVTDSSGTPPELLNMPILNADTEERSFWFDKSNLAATLIRDLREGKLPGISEIPEYRRKDFDKPLFYSVPGGRSDRVLVITFTPIANYD